MASKEQIVATLKGLGAIARNVQLKRALTAVDSDPPLNFWRLIHGNLLDTAVVEWCKIFGTDSEPGHWKKIVPDEKAFRIALIKKLGITEREWDEYWKTMTSYRNEMAVHAFEKISFTHFPKLDNAIASACLLYEVLIAELRKSGEKRFPDDLTDYADRFYRQAVEIAGVAAKATAKLEEKVY